jgi:hypothetical protein
MTGGAQKVTRRRIIPLISTVEVALFEGQTTIDQCLLLRITIGWSSSQEYVPID